ncbi:MAG: hypothetical protein JW850_16030, partial [Thermoflexales bacterium]|nr:hypothetical protein [Thermoflexales bacterium]
LVLTHPTGQVGGLPRYYDIVGDGGGFSATLRVCYTHADLAWAGISLDDEARLALYRYEPGAGWVLYPSTVDRAANTVAARVDRFSRWAIGLPQASEPTVVAMRHMQSRATGLAWAAALAMAMLAGWSWVRRAKRKS